MSAANDSLILHLDFDEIEDGKVEDLSPFDHDATVNGSAALVPDDLLGSCLSFDGADDYVSLPDLGGDYANGLTVEAWVFYSGFRNWSRILDIGNGPSSDNIVLANAGATNNLSLYVFRGGAGKSVDAAGALRANEWLHVAATVGRDGGATLYVNAEAVKTAALHLPQRVARTNNYIGKSNWPSDALFGGKIASVRVYSRALSADEIRLDMEEDRTAAAAFRAAHPLDFSLYDEDDHPVLYITADGTSHSLNLEITNSSRQAIRLVTPNGSAPDANNNNFELRFRPGTLASSAFDRVGVAEGGWRLGKARQADGSVSLYLSGADGTTVNPTEKIKLTLQNVSADPGDGARGTRIELKYGGLRYASDATAVAGTRVQHLSVVNQTGRKNVPLHVGFIGSNTVLNEGGTTNKLKLRISNTLKTGAIPLNPDDGGKKPTKFVVSFDVQGDGEQKEWALGTQSDVQAIKITARDAQGGQIVWKVKEPTKGISPEWVVTAPSGTEMPAGDVIELTIDNIITALPSGFTNLYVHYENLPGYWDGQFVAPIEKGPVTYRAGNVGVGTATYDERLTVAGNLNVEGTLTAQRMTLARVNEKRGGLFLACAGDFNHAIYNNYSNIDGEGQWDGSKWNTFAGLNVRVGNGSSKKSALFINEAGNIGVGTTAPGEKLSVAGSAVAQRLSVAPTNETRGGLFLACVNDFNHVIYNNYSNIDGEGSWDGAKWNIGGGLNVRVGGGSSKRSALVIDGAGNVGVGTTRPSARLSVNGPLGVSASDSSPGVITQVFEGRIDNGQTLTLNLYSLRSHRSSHLELVVMMHDINSDTYRLYQKADYGCFREWDRPPRVELLAQAYRKFYSQDIYKAEPVAIGNDIHVRLSQSGFATNTVYQVVARYMMVGM